MKSENALLGIKSREVQSKICINSLYDLDCSNNVVNEKMNAERRNVLLNLNNLLDMFLAYDVVSMEMMKHESQVSDRKNRQLLADLRSYEKRGGFRIKTLMKQGYYLQVDDEVLFHKVQHFLKETAVDVSGNKQYRVSVMISLLLQNKNYITIHEIAEILDVSRNTIISDLELTKATIAKYDLTLVSKSHYGLKMVGKEQSMRKILSKITADIIDHQLAFTEYFEFTKKLKFDDVHDKFTELLQLYGIVMSANAIESILIHLRVLMYRISQKNEIHDVQVNKELIGKQSYQLASELTVFISERYNVQIQEQEIDLLASQIFGKVISNEIPAQQREALKASIYHSLVKIDEEYGTTFEEDELLQESLLLHVYPLLLRATFGLELSSSLVGSISAQYTNAFLVSLRFIEHHKELKKYNLSRDEIGYLALHFATHHERNNQRLLDTIRRIVIVSDTLRSNVQLLKLQVQNLFPKALVKIKPYTTTMDFLLEDVDVILSAVLLPAKYDKVAILIPALLDEQSSRQLKSKILFQMMDSSEKAPSLDRLFYEDIFFYEDGTDYLAMLRKYSKKMVAQGYANADFPASLLAREKRFTTVYENGIAGPHSMHQNANVDSIGVIIMKRRVFYEEREVRCIFLLNIREKHLFLHQEISDFIMKVMNDPKVAKRLYQSKSFKEFKVHVKGLW